MKNNNTKYQSLPLPKENLSRRVSEEGGESADSCVAEKVYRRRFSRIVLGRKGSGISL
jgi:hypothetical protein